MLNGLSSDNELIEEMHTVSITGHKGGIGKTTLSILIAAKAVQDGKRVALIDLDPQKSLCEWWEQRPEDDPLKVLHVDKLEQLEEAQKLLKQDHDLLIIDTPPTQQFIIKAAIRIADLIVVPCSPSPMDIKGIGETITLLEASKKPFFFVLNRVNSRTRIAKDTIPLLAQHGKVAPVTLELRIDYAQGMLEGSTPLEFGNKQLNDEVYTLYQYLTEQLEKL